MATIDLENLGSAGVIIRGIGPYTHLGRSVSSAGDVNGDGLEDFIVAALNTDGERDAGAWVLFGDENGIGEIDLATLSESDGFYINGALSETEGYTIQAVSSAGDVNGDGFDDLLIGGPRYTNDLMNQYSGQAWVVLGKAEGFGTIELDDLSSDQGYVIETTRDGEWLGYSVSSAGDINGDGFDEVLIGGMGNRAHILFGKADDFHKISLDTLPASDGFTIVGDGSDDFAGTSVAAAGDFNNDGFDDYIVGAQNGGTNSAGEAYIVFGKASGLQNFDLTGFTASQGFVVRGAPQFAQLGVSVASAGDVNGDGFDDVVVGTLSADRAYIIFGRAAGSGGINVGTLGESGGILIYGAEGNLGESVSGAGDVNGDGFADVVIGNRLSAAGGQYTGGAYVIYGRATGGSVRVDTLSAAQGFFIQGETAGDQAGRALSGADVNADGFSDVIIGSNNNNEGGFAAGAVYVVYGAEPTSAVNRLGTAVGQTIRGGIGDDTLDGAGGEDQLFGAGGIDDLDGGTGHDRLNGGAGADTMTGGIGNDLFVVDTYASGGPSDQVVEAADGGSDTVESSVSYFLAANVETLRLTGTAAIRGTGNGGANTLIGNGAANSLSGGAGDDRIDGGAGADTMRGGTDNDTYVVDDSRDAVVEAADAGTDRVESSVSFTLAAEVENLLLVGSGAINGTGNSLANIITGNAAANVLNGGGGGDTLAGRGGDDIYVVDSAEDRVSEASGGGTDRVNSAVSFTLGAGFENLLLTGAGAIDGTGNGLANALTGNGAANVLNGGGGNDVLNGAAGADEMIGGINNDVYRVDNEGDKVVEAAGAGTDRVDSSISYTLGADVENLVLTETAANGTGNGLANAISGNGASNRLDGGTGADILTGGAGGDTYVVDTAADKVVETSSGGGVDRVDASVSYTLGSYVENLTLTGSGTNAGTGNSLANVITGNAAANLLKGEAGNDRLFGGSGKDQLYGGSGNDRIYGGSGDDLLYGESGADGFYFDKPLSLSNNVDRLADFSAAADTIFLSRAVFTGISANGILDAAAFRLGPGAADASDRIVYDQSSGRIFYDQDGLGGAGQVLFATVAAGTVLTSADFSAFI